MWTPELYRNLLNGYLVTTYGRYGARLRDEKGNPVFKLRSARFQSLKSGFLRQRKDGVYIIDLRKVRSLHGNHICKKLYKEIRNAKTAGSAEKK